VSIHRLWRMKGYWQSFMAFINPLLSNTRLLPVFCSLMLTLSLASGLFHTQAAVAESYNNEAAYTSPTEIRTVLLSPDGRTLSILSGTSSRSINANTPPEFSMETASFPARVMVRFPNAILRTSSSRIIIPVEKNGIREIEVAQTGGFLSKKSVLVTISGDNEQALSQIRPLPISGGVVLAFSNQAIANRQPGRNYTPGYTASSTAGAYRSAQANRYPVPDSSGRMSPSGVSSSRISSSTSIQRMEPVTQRVALNPSPNIPRSDILLKPLPVAQNVIQDIYFRDGKLLVETQKGSKLLVKNQLFLTDPSRLVLDLKNTSVSNYNLLTTLEVGQEGIQRVRIGQFDDATVRLVIETEHPEKFQIFQADSGANLLVIQPHTSSPGIFIAGSTVTRPNAAYSTQQPAVLDSVLVARGESGKPVIRLNATRPLIHHLYRDNQNLYMELENVVATPGWVHFDKEQFPQLGFIRVKTAGTSKIPQATVVLTLRKAIGDVGTKVINDGRGVDIVLGGEVTNLAQDSEKLIPEQQDTTDYSRISADKAPYAARIVIDAGHGGKDIGANRDGVYEKNLNLSMALKLKEALEARGMKVYMTRSSDVFLPLPEITRIANEIQPDLFVSIHQNASTNSGINGIETYYYTGKSVPLAQRVHRRLTTVVGAPDRGVRKAMFYVIHHTTVPAILCEVGYISNSGERAQLAGEWRQRKTAEAIAEGVVDYLKTRVTAQGR
jgi:N-acetylmuramoyl-L-alanine amidase